MSATSPKNIKLPNPPTTSEFLRETLQQGAASIIGNAIDESGVCITPEVISDVVEFYESYELSIKASKMGDRRKIVRQYLLSDHSKAVSEKNEEHWVAVVSNDHVALVTNDIIKALDHVDIDDSFSCFCCASKTKELATIEASVSIGAEKIFAPS
jgi:hypothetical protein